MGTRWWTSATDQGCPGKLAWCGSGEMFSEQELGPIKGSSKFGEKCVTIVARNGEFSLEAASCLENNRPLCEVKTVHFGVCCYCIHTAFFLFIGQHATIKGIHAE
jgi:hypothetical protein